MEHSISHKLNHMLHYTTGCYSKNCSMYVLEPRVLLKKNWGHLEKLPILDNQKRLHFKNICWIMQLKLCLFSSKQTKECRNDTINLHVNNT